MSFPETFVILSLKQDREAATERLFDLVRLYADLLEAIQNRIEVCAHFENEGVNPKSHFEHTCACHAEAYEHASQIIDEVCEEFELRGLPQDGPSSKSLVERIARLESENLALRERLTSLEGASSHGAS